MLYARDVKHPIQKNITENVNIIIGTLTKLDKLTVSRNSKHQHAYIQKQDTSLESITEGVITDKRSGLQ
jgi:hypothetical protein